MCIPLDRVYFDLAAQAVGPQVAQRKQERGVHCQRRQLGRAKVTFNHMFGFVFSALGAKQSPPEAVPSLTAEEKLTVGMTTGAKLARGGDA